MFLPFNFSASPVDGGHQRQKSDDSLTTSEVSVRSWEFTNPHLSEEEIVEKALALEHAEFDETQTKLKGEVGVKAFHYKQRVFIRYSFDLWQTYQDVPGMNHFLVLKPVETIK